MIAGNLKDINNSMSNADMNEPDKGKDDGEDDADDNDEQEMLDDIKEEESKIEGEISAERAKRIHDSISNKLLPQLRKCLTKKVFESFKNILYLMCQLVCLVVVQKGVF